MSPGTGIRSFLIRLWHPPKLQDGSEPVKNHGIIPVYHVQLQDVLDRKHLPPLGLKDFEEWLLYVEGCVENLYFILWLQEYTTKYEQWALSCRNSSTPRPNLRSYRVHPQLQFSPALSMFYLRAKQTFLMSDAPFELVRVPPGVLAPFQIPASHPQPPNPDPAIFSELAFELRKQLQASLDRFAVACYQNVGTKRAACGMVGGSVIALIGSLPPLACEISFSTNRWLRLTALPGMWLGVWFLIAAFNGVCMIIYIFGDVRQLHKYELAQPPISAPQPASSSPFAHYPTASFSPAQSPVSASSLPMRPPPAHLALDTSSAALQSFRFSSPSASYHADLPSPITPVQEGEEDDNDDDDDDDDDDSDDDHDDDEDMDDDDGDDNDGDAHRPGPVIQISAAYCDDIPDPDALYEPDPQPICAAKDLNMESSPEMFPPTATFIHRFNEAEQKQAMSGFDFASLPPRRSKRPSSGATNTQQQSFQSASPRQQTDVTADEHTSWALPKVLIGRLQNYCTGSIGLAHIDPSDLEKGTARVEPLPSLSPSVRKGHPEEDEAITARLKYIRSVPAFAVPLTRILSPVIARGQWLIVVRSAVLSLIFCAIVVGSLIAIPERI